MRPLSDITIIDMSRLIPGAFCTWLLSELGARVIKIEEPGLGDFYRDLPGGPILGEGMFEALNRGKESLVLNVKSDEGQVILQDLLRDADVLVESFRPRKLKKLGFGFAKLKKNNPRLILCSITGYGQTGEYADRAGHDLNFIGQSGLLQIDESTVPFVPHMQLADFVGGGMHSAIAVLAAIHRRHLTKQGTWIDMSMLEGVMSLGMGWLALIQSSPSDFKQYFGLLTGKAASYCLFETKDKRYISVAALEQQFWKRLSDRFGLGHSIVSGFDPATMSLKLKRQLTAVFKKQPMAYWRRFIGKEDLCISELHSMKTVLSNRQLNARRFFLNMKSKAGKRMRHCKSPYVFDAKRSFRSGNAPILGEHTDQILTELGVGLRDLRSLKLKGVIQ
jgi:alpha-methylacyl-CoA racemase